MTRQALLPTTRFAIVAMLLLLQAACGGGSSSGSPAMPTTVDETDADGAPTTDRDPLPEPPALNDNPVAGPDGDAEEPGTSDGAVMDPPAPGGGETTPPPTTDIDMPPNKTDGEADVHSGPPVIGENGQQVDCLERLPCTWVSAAGDWSLTLNGARRTAIVDTSGGGGEGAFRGQLGRLEIDFVLDHPTVDSEDAVASVQFRATAEDGFTYAALNTASPNPGSVFVGAEAATALFRQRPGSLTALEFLLIATGEFEPAGFTNVPTVFTMIDRLAETLDALPLPPACDPGEEYITFASTPIEAIGADLSGAYDTLIDAIDRELDGAACAGRLRLPLVRGDYNLNLLRASDHVDLMAVDSLVLREVSPLYALFDLPFVFEDRGALASFAASDASAPLKAAVPGATGLTLWNPGFTQLMSVEPLALPDEIGRFVLLSAYRNEEAISETFYTNGLGASVIPLGLEGASNAQIEILGIDAAELHWPEIEARAVTDVLPNATGLDLRATPLTLFASQAWWDGLDPNLRASLERLIGEHAATLDAGIAAGLARSREAVFAAADSARTLDPSARAAWVEVARPVQSLFAEQVDAALLEQALEAR